MTNNLQKILKEAEMHKAKAEQYAVEMHKETNEQQMLILRELVHTEFDFYMYLKYVVAEMVKGDK